MPLRSYLNQFRRQVRKLEDHGFSESLELKEEIRANKLAVVTAAVVLVNDSSLHIKAYIDGRYKIERISYSCHYQDSRGNCIFRYDNANHGPLPGSREHKHLNDGAIIESQLPEPSEIIEEVIREL
jgi:hypothetical protein